MAIILVYTNITVQTSLGPRKERLPILTYHRVVEVRPRGKWVPYVLRKDFESQLSMLRRRGYQSIDLEELGRWFAGQQGQSMPPRKVIVITFDDGWKDNYTIAFPLLKKYGFKATFFLITEKIGTPGYMNIDEIREMQHARMRFGSHTLTHPRLALVTGKEAWNEIYYSKVFLERLLGEEVDTFSYPYGDYDRKIEDMVRRAGYVFACSSEFGDNSREADRLRLKRILISRSGMIARIELYLEITLLLAPIRSGFYWFTSTYPVEYAIRLTLPGGNSGRHIS